MKTYYPLLLTIMAFFFLYIGMKVVLSKKPLFISSRYFFALMVIVFSPQLLTTADIFFLGGLSGKLKLIFLIGPLMFVCLLAYFWILMKGYMAIGVSSDSLRDALHFSLSRINQPFEETLSVIKLTSINANLQIAVQSWIGTAQIRLRQSKETKLLTEIIAGINEYYIKNKIKPNNVTSIFYIIIGVFMLVFAGAFYYSFL